MISTKTLDRQRIGATEPGTTLRAMLADAGVGISEAAQRLGINRVTMSQLLAHTKPVTIPMAKRIEKEFGVSAYALARLQFERDFADDGK